MGYGLAIGSTRLFAAADFLLESIDSGAARRRAIPQYAAEPHPDGPPPTRAFTRLELAEAMSLLLRMGFVNAETPYG